jgi:hypothetical protein
MAKTLTDPATGAQVRYVTRRKCGLPSRKGVPRGQMLRPHGIGHHGVGRGNGLSLSAVMAIWRGYHRYHVQKKGWSYSGYSHGWADAPDVGGAVLDARGWGRDGAHTQRGRNRDGYACSYVGDGRQPIADTAWRAWRAWLWHGQRQGAFPQDVEISGHSDWWSKLCPGPNIITPLHAKSKFTAREQSTADGEGDDVTTPTQVVITETEDEAHEKPTRRLVIDYAVRQAHHIRSSSEDEYWRNLARASSNPEVVAGGRWSAERVRMHCAESAVKLDLA